MYHPGNPACKVAGKHLHEPLEICKTCCMNRWLFSDESKKKLWRPCREVRALGL